MSESLRVDLSSWSAECLSICDFLWLIKDLRQIIPVFKHSLKTIFDPNRTNRVFRPQTDSTNPTELREGRFKE